MRCDFNIRIKSAFSIKLYELLKVDRKLIYSFGKAAAYT